MIVPIVASIALLDAFFVPSTKVTHSPGANGATTVIAQVADTPLLVLVAVIVTVPEAIAVTTPLASTVAIEGLDEVHVTSVFNASLGVIVAVIVTVSPTSNVALVGLRVIIVTFVSIHCAYKVTSSERE